MGRTKSSLCFGRTRPQTSKCILRIMMQWHRKNPELAKAVRDCINDILDEAFKGVYWYRRAKAYCKHLNEQSGEQRTVVDTCFSGLWMTLRTKGGAVHKDHNVVGPAFVLSTCEGLEETHAFV